ncbi:DUF3710 domain-containing protein [Gordonia amarae]|uniref:DUF3710 domain-containing protein n=2 Tax=Gordonia amarae TaxID=36821 RepID=G7GVV3_9ACTN|nr:DUF3710 domain-containing protein [Gordonia amarae]MCS3878806.1 hypothetical protein [Gordonia amarae]QHN17378.1 DUF3710 domain-containing protein [Gordonia amarae]QHN21904.1 DUF3710 domain-containing protein [Gordonia amarae]QHN30753.1 DUF3710 domain-containing protein [Gordonia amarae]QHN39530.1 DUF3710 domain-containing protein [Gordonia amarae]
MARQNATQGLRIGQAAGPYDIDALVTSLAELQNSHLDLGSVLVPVVEGGQVTVEMTADHQPEAVYLVTPFGRIGVAAFAAPKTPGTWREVVRELAESLRDSGATTSIEDGHWGREVVAEVPGTIHRFIGVDGPRWLVRCVASGPTEATEPLSQLARAVLAESVVRRGNDPYPPREALPIELPDVLAAQVAAAQQEMVEAGEPGFEDVPAYGAEEHDGGALDQLSQATVVNADDEDFDDRAGYDDPAAYEDDGEAGAQGGPEPSSGSAMQRLRRRSWRR